MNPGDQKPGLPSRRFRCKGCGAKCRASKADRGKREYCRPCEERVQEEL